MVMIKVRSYAPGKEIVGFGIPKFVAYNGEFPKVEIPSGAKPKKKGKNK
jgi:hypothetical protein